MTSPTWAAFRDGTFSLTTAFPQSCPTCSRRRRKSLQGFMAIEAEQALVTWNPLIAEVIRRRGLFGAVPPVTAERAVDQLVRERRKSATCSVIP